MKATVYGLLAIAAMAATAATANNKRAITRFYQQTPGGNNWIPVPGTYDASKCKVSTTAFCSYTLSSTVTPPNPATAATLVALGAVAHDQNKIYKP